MSSNTFSKRFVALFITCFVIQNFFEKRENRSGVFEHYQLQVCILQKLQELTESNVSDFCDSIMIIYDLSKNIVTITDVRKKSN